LRGAERRVGTLQDQLVNLTMHAEHEVRTCLQSACEGCQSRRDLEPKL
jgi:hypothetical protein